jgi:hypothetical protein
MTRDIPSKNLKITCLWKGTIVKSYFTITTLLFTIGDIFMHTDGKMTDEQRELLTFWHQLEQGEAIIERGKESDPIFKAQWDAWDRAAEFDLVFFEGNIAGDVAKFHALGYTKAEWLATSPDLPQFLKDEQIQPDEVEERLGEAKAILASIGLWPW